MDLQLHADRLDGKEKRTYRTPIESLADGSFVAIDGRPWLIAGAHLHAWTDAAYTEKRPRLVRGDVDVLTPRSAQAVLSAGYRPAIHPSAGERLDAEQRP